MSTSGDPLRDALCWLNLHRELGIHEVAPRRPEKTVSDSTRAQVAGAPSEAPAVGLAAQDPAEEAVTATAAAEALVRLREELGECTRCGLCSGRQKIVFGCGNPSARLLFVGEGPGADEDRQGVPFVGKSGQLLDRIIGAMGLRREDVYIANIVKCRPPENRAPLPDEAATCLPFLEKQVDIIQPEVIVALGRSSLEGLKGEPGGSITHARGQWFRYRGIAAMATFHPAYLFHNPEAKRPVWDDMQEVMARLNPE